MNYYRASKGTSPLSRYICDTSIDAYHELREMGVLETQEADYLSLLLQNVEGLTDAEAAHFLHLPCSTVSARRNGINAKHIRAMELRGDYSYHLIICDGRRKNPSGMTANVWRLNHEKNKRRY